jgi:tetratricopeptide (TPR) repeat protein
MDEAQRYFEEGLAIQRQLGNQWGIAEVLNNLGQTALRQGRIDEARKHHAESLDIAREIENHQGVAMALGSFGLLASADGDLARAARLLGASKALHNLISAPAPSDTQAELDLTLERIIKEMGERTFAEAWAEGQAMPLEHAIALALEREATDP